MKSECPYASSLHPCPCSLRPRNRPRERAAGKAHRRETKREVCGSGRVPRHSSVQGHREDAPQRPEGHRRADRLPEHRLAPDSGADGLAQRGRAGQVGLRALLRAHDVPRHAGVSAREVPGDRSRSSGARQNAYTTDDYTNYHITFPKDDLETMLEIEADRFQNLKYDEADFKTEARAVLGEYNKNSANPIVEARRGPCSDKAFTTHTYKHTTMGFLKRHRGHAQPVRVLARPSSTAGTAPSTRRSSWPATSTRRDGLPLVEKYWGAWKRADTPSPIPQEPPAKGPVYAHVPWTSRDAPLGHRRVPRPGVLRDEEGSTPRSTCSSTSRSATRRTSTRSSSSRSRRSTSSSPSVDVHQDPDLVTVFARVKKRDGRRLRARSRSSRRCAAAARRARRREAPRRGEVERPLRLRPRPRQHGGASRPLLARFVRYSPVLRHVNQLLPRSTRP